MDPAAKVQVGYGSRFCRPRLLACLFNRQSRHNPY